VNQTTTLETQLRNLTRLIARAREAAAQQTHLRDTSIRQYGLAHPRSIDETRRLNHTQSVSRALMGLYRTSASDLARRRRHE
jgi:hypothetical protein